MEALLLLWIACGVGCAAIAHNRGRSVGAWLVTGALTGIVGLLVVLVLPARRPETAPAPKPGPIGHRDEWRSNPQRPPALRWEHPNTAYDRELARSRRLVAEARGISMSQDKPAVRATVAGQDGQREWRIGVVGESFNNPDGTSRQDIIARIGVGDAIELRREPDNPHDHNAIAVVHELGQIGYVPRGSSGRMAAEIDRGKRFGARVKAINSRNEATANSGVVLDVWRD